MVSRASWSCRKGSDAWALVAALAVVLVASSARAERSTETLWTEVERAAAGGPADLDAIVAAAGKDPKALVAWMQANIRFEPYEGVLVTLTDVTQVDSPHVCSADNPAS